MLLLLLAAAMAIRYASKSQMRFLVVVSIYTLYDTMLMMIAVCMRGKARGIFASVHAFVGGFSPNKHDARAIAVGDMCIKSKMMAFCEHI